MTKAKKKVKDLSMGKIYINATFNNTMITITDAKGDTLAWASSGAMGFKGESLNIDSHGHIVYEHGGKTEVMYDDSTGKVKTFEEIFQYNRQRN